MGATRTGSKGPQTDPRGSPSQAPEPGAGQASCCSIPGLRLSGWREQFLRRAFEPQTPSAAPTLRDPAQKGEGFLRLPPSPPPGGAQPCSGLDQPQQQAPGGEANP